MMGAMKHFVIALTLGLAACKGSKNNGGKVPAQEPTKPAAANLPQLANAAATLLPTTGAPQLVVFVDANGAIRVGPGPASWAELNGANLDAKAVPIDGNELRQINVRANLRGDKVTGVALIEELIQDREQRRKESPPPPESDPEDLNTGTAMALDEGKMGRKDATEEDKEVRRRGYCQPGRGSLIAGGVVAEVEAGARACNEMADVLKDGVISVEPWDYPYSVLVAAPTAKVAPLLPFSDFAGVIAVSVAGKVRLLRLLIGERKYSRRSQGNYNQQWIEVRISATGLELRRNLAQPESDFVPPTVPWSTGPLDAAALGKAYADTRATSELNSFTPVDVLVAPDTDMQHLAEVFAALDAAGATTIGVGNAPKDKPRDPVGSGDGAGRENNPNTTVTAKLGTPTVAGLAADVVQGYLQQKLTILQYCYEKALLSDASLAGTVDVVFEIDSNGDGKPVQAIGVSDAVASCVADVLGDIQFPKPSDGGSAHVVTTIIYAQTPAKSP